MNTKLTKRLLALCCAGALALAGTGCSAEEPSSAANRLEEIQERGYIEVATEPYFSPYEFIDPSKSGDAMYVGSDIELAHHIADSLGVECHIVPLEFSAVLAGVTSGKYDLAISALAYTPARAEAMALSDGYYFDTGENSGYGLMVRTEDLAAITSADDLADRTVVVQSGSMQELLLNTQVPAVGETKLVSATTDGFLMVQEDKADAIITAIGTAQLYIEANPGCGLSIVPDFKFTEDPAYAGTRVGLPLNEPELLEGVDEIIAEVNEQGLYAGWYDEYLQYARDMGIN